MYKKAMYYMALMAGVVALLMTGMPVCASQTDDRIESSAKQSYVFKAYLKDDDIKVQSKDGVVTLTGVVANEFHQSLAQETVSGLPGVKRVDNRLDIKEPPSTANSDAWIRDRVKATLLFHRSVSASSTGVVVNGGIVTLSGNATSQAQKELTAEYAKDIEGVKDVVNEMAVSTASGTPPQSTGEMIDDASITAQVKMSLLFHRSTSAVHTSVNTDQGGVVTLTGVARNTAEKDLVTKLVNDVPGVRIVINKMTVE